MSANNFGKKGTNNYEGNYKNIIQISAYFRI